MGAWSSLLGIISILYLLSSGLLGALPGSHTGQQADATAQENDAAKSALERIGEQHVKVSAEQRHTENLATRAPVTEPYVADLRYGLTAEGAAARISDNSSAKVNLSLDLSVWKSTDTLVSMDIMNGTLQLDDDAVAIHSGHAYYLPYARQVRVIAYIVEDPGEDPALQILVLKARTDEGRLPFPDSNEPLGIEILSPQSGLTPEWLMELNGGLALEASPVPTEEKNKVILTAILSDERVWDKIMNDAEEELEKRHPGLDIEINQVLLPYSEIREQSLSSIGNGTTIDLLNVDQIWLGEFAERGYLTDLSDAARAWGRSSEWYQANWDGGTYKGRTYAIWAWTDIRGIWYWKDLLKEADVDPNSLKTWDGYISAAQELNAKLRPKGIEGVHLTGASHSPDLWFPYLWMLDGEILEIQGGHPTRGSYWYPSYNQSNGVRAMEFLKQQVDAGIKPQREHSWGSEFVNRSFAVMIEGSWMPGAFPPEERADLETKIGFLPLIPVPEDGDQSATLMGGWLFSVPETSKNKELALELVMTMVEPRILVPLLVEYGYLPTQLPIGEGSYSDEMRQSSKFYDEMVSMLPIGHIRPNIPEYSLIAEHIRQAIDEVYSGEKTPKQALDDAAAKSAIALGWTG